ncbi:MAG: hypothetical protein ACREBD_31700 [Blastocatellia bacterium]
MRYLLDSNILRAYTAKHPALTRNLARIPAGLIGIPFVVAPNSCAGASTLISRPSRKIC